MGAIAGAVFDPVVDDPTRAHPGAELGCLPTLLERRTWRPTCTAGAVGGATPVGPVALIAAMVDRAPMLRPVPRAALFVATRTWSVLGVAGLRRRAAGVGQALESGDLRTGRGRAALRGRDASALKVAGLRRAVVESAAARLDDVNRPFRRRHWYPGTSGARS